MYIYTHTFAADWSGGYSREQLLRVRDLAVDFSLFLSPEQLASHHYTKPLLLQSLSTLSPSLTRYFIPCSTRRSASPDDTIFMCSITDVHVLGWVECWATQNMK